MQAADTTVRVRIKVSGIIQGVGFRPFAHELASVHRLSGYIRNHNGVVDIEVQGQALAVEKFVNQLKIKSPPAALIKGIDVQAIDVSRDSARTFEILKSAADETKGMKLCPPDMTTCQACLQELFDPRDHRFRYPFINCTNCGPRFTIIDSLPYDRESTTMSSFKMCVLCRRQYDDPTDRRFHAQPNACPSCGPSLSFFNVGSIRQHACINSKQQDVSSSHCATNNEAIRLTVDALGRGKIMAVKGLGGFHLMCDACDGNAVQRLRQRKMRDSKPFALMMRDLVMVRQYCECSLEEEDELTVVARPIVLLKKLPNCALPDEIAPGVGRLGVMLPYTPLHHLLLADYGKPLVATSGNLSEEPIAINNAEATRRLSDIADCFLLHDREIYSRYDDSIVQRVPGAKMTMRRARGMAPLPVALYFKSKIKILACGAHLKNTFCLINDDQAFISQHIGDMENLETEEHFEHTLSTYQKLLGIEPCAIAHDLHPDYRSTRFAENYAGKYGIPAVAVQHHHAHVVSCMAEHGLMDEVIGVAFDGLGLGPDNTLWGGEFLLCSYKDYKRVAHFEPIPLPGGNQAIKQPWRIALGYIFSDPQDRTDLYDRFLEDIASRYGPKAVNLVRAQTDQHLNSPLTSSCGRLFDAVSALLDLCWQASYEGQAAMELKSCAGLESGYSDDIYDFGDLGIDLPLIIKPHPILAAVYRDLLADIPICVTSFKFHKTIAHLVVTVASHIKKLTGRTKVCLSGGVFQNNLLMQMILELSRKMQLEVYFPQQVPANDGGLSLGQAVIALAQLDGIKHVPCNSGTN